jgi:hypothetical protein
MQRTIDSAHQPMATTTGTAQRLTGALAYEAWAATEFPPEVVDDPGL